MLENERVGGPRQYSGPEAKVVAIWKCVACGEQNDGPLVDGCVHCGSGRPGVHKGVDPVVTPEERQRILAAQNKPSLAVVKPAVEASTFPGNSLVDFDAWYGAQPIRVNEKMRTWLYKAYVAGWQAAAQQPESGLELDELPTADPIDENRPGDSTGEVEPPQFPPGQIKERTLLAALRSFRDTILPDAQEEVTTREWLGVAEVEQWIAEIEKELTHE